MLRKIDVLPIWSFVWAGMVILQTDWHRSSCTPSLSFHANVRFDTVISIWWYYLVVPPHILHSRKALPCTSFSCFSWDLSPSSPWAATMICLPRFSCRLFERACRRHVGWNGRATGILLSARIAWELGRVLTEFISRSRCGAKTIYCASLPEIECNIHIGFSGVTILFWY